MKKRYRVAGPNVVFGHRPGDVFDRDIPDAQEARLLASGALTVSRAQEPDAVDKPTSSEQKEQKP